MQQVLILNCTRFKIFFVNVPWRKGWILNDWEHFLIWWMWIAGLIRYFPIFSPTPTPSALDLGVCLTFCVRKQEFRIHQGCLFTFIASLLLQLVVFYHNQYSASLWEGVRSFLVPCGVQILIWTLSNPLPLPESAFISNPKVQLLWFIFLWSE